MNFTKAYLTFDKARAVGPLATRWYYAWKLIGNVNAFRRLGELRAVRDYHMLFQLLRTIYSEAVNISKSAYRYLLTITWVGCAKQHYIWTATFALHILLCTA